MTTALIQQDVESWTEAVEDMDEQLKISGFDVRVSVDPWENSYDIWVQGPSIAIGPNFGEAEAIMSRVAKQHGLAPDWLLAPPLRALRYDSYHGDRLVTGEFVGGALRIVVGMNAVLDGGTSPLSLADWGH